MGSIEFFELGEISKTVQCPSCLKYSKKRTVCCLCGMCLKPSPALTEKFKKSICEIISDPFNFIMEGHSGERHGPKIVAVRPFEGERRDKRLEKERVRLSRAPMAYGSTISRILKDTWMDRRILSIPGLPHHHQYQVYRNRARKIKVSQHCRVEVQRWEESRKDVKSRRFSTCSPITCCFQTPGRKGKPLTFRSLQETGKYRLMKSCDQNLSGKVGISKNSSIAGVIFIFDNMVGTPTMARTIRLAWMAGMARLSTDSLSRQVTLHNFLHIRVKNTFAYRQ